MNKTDTNVVSVRDLVMEFPLSRGVTVHAVSGVSFDIRRGETLGLVGESGCGKSTTARAVMQLPPPTRGSVKIEGIELTELDAKALREQRRHFQMIFQDPISSLNPRRRVEDIVSMPLDILGEGTPAERKARTRDVIEAVGLDPNTALDRRPFQFSGGQCQRISIARALVLNPSVLICDEPVSALDVSIQAQIVNLLQDMKARYDLTMLFISHDLSIVKNVCDKIAVMYLGQVCEMADSHSLYEQPRHPYTAALLSAVPEPDPEKPLRKVAMTEGEPPSPIAPPAGCRFHTRCPYVQPKCSAEVPQLNDLGNGRSVACHFPLS
jgi:peptide/nickel transport system ATP-binding protein